MKVYKTIRTYKAVWELLRDMKLDALLTGAGKDGKLNLPVTELLTMLLEEGKAVAFFKAITRAEKYVGQAGTHVPTWKDGQGQAQPLQGASGTDVPTEWEDVDINILIALASDFFGLTDGTWGALKQHGLKAVTAEQLQDEGTRSQGSNTTSPGSE